MVCENTEISSTITANRRSCPSALCVSQRGMLQEIPTKPCALTQVGWSSEVVCYDADSPGKLVTPPSWLPHPSARGHHLACCHLSALSLPMQSVKKMKDWELAPCLVSITNNVISPHYKYGCLLHIVWGGKRSAVMYAKHFFFVLRCLFTMWLSNV